MNGQTDREEKSGGNYPYYPLAACLPIADAVKSLGKQEVSKSLLASSLKEDQRSQTLQFKLASAKTFGMIEGRRQYSLTEIAKRYFFPTVTNDRQNALLEFLAHPRAFGSLIERFDGSKLPPVEILGNILHKESGVPESWKDRVAGMFLRSAQFISAVDEEGHLRVKALRERGDTKSVGTEEPTPPDGSASEIGKNGGSDGVMRCRRVEAKLNPGAKVFSHSETDEATGQSRTIYVETPRPEDLSLASWELLNFYVQSLKPKAKT